MGKISSKRLEHLSLCSFAFCSFRRGEAAKTNFPVSDYQAELDHLRIADYDTLVADLRTEVSNSCNN